MSSKIKKKIDGYNYEDFVWRTREGVTIHLKDMATSHILNARKMLKLSHSFHGETSNGISITAWIEAMSRELKSRPPEIITKNSVEIKDVSKLLLTLAKRMGVPIPESGAGVYVNDRNIDTMKLFVKWDESKPLKSKKRKLKKRK